MRFLIIFLAMAALIQSCSSRHKPGFYYKDYETPAYEVVKSFENIEIRKYPAILVAEVEVEGSREEGVKKGFRILARYIFGNNIAKQTIAMTSPVSQSAVSEKIAMTSAVSQIKKSEKKWYVQFSIPKQYTLKNLPKAQSKKIKFKIIKPKKVVAIDFSGSWSDKIFDQKKAELQKFVKENCLVTRGLVTINYYDDPFTFPWNRRNEIIQEIKPQTASRIKLSIRKKPNCKNCKRSLKKRVL